MVCALTAMMTCGNVFAEDITEAVEDVAEVSTEADEALTEAETEAETEAGPKSVLKDSKWSDFEVAFDGKVMKFPFSATELSEDGWIMEAAYKGTKLDPYNYIEAQVKKGDHIAYFYIANLTEEPTVAEEATVVGIRVSNTKWASDDLTLTELPGGIFRGISTDKDLTAAYGESSGSFEMNGVTTYSYIVNEYERFDIEAGVNGVVDGFKIMNFTLPEGTEAKQVSPDPTDAVKAYKAPEKLSDNLTDFDVKMGDFIVELPCPVSYFTENGWEIADGEGVIAANGEAWVTLKKDDVSVDTILVNIESDPQDATNCWVDSLDFGVDYNSDFEISGGIKIGTTKEDVLNAIADAGIEYTETEIGDYTYIEYNTSDMMTGVLLSVYNGKEEGHEAGKVDYISIYNAYKGITEDVAEESTEAEEAATESVAEIIETEAETE